VLPKIPRNHRQISECAEAMGRLGLTDIVLGKCRWRPEGIRRISRSSTSSTSTTPIPSSIYRLRLPKASHNLSVQKLIMCFICYPFKVNILPNDEPTCCIFCVESRFITHLFLSVLFVVNIGVCVSKFSVYLS
jgi:hypothetical protein